MFSLKFNKLIIFLNIYVKILNVIYSREYIINHIYIEILTADFLNNN